MLVVVHFVVQVALQGLTLRDNQQAKGVTNLCLSLAQVPMGLPLLDRDGLSMCDGIPGHNDVACVLIASASAPPLPPNGVRPRALSDFNLDGVSSITLAGTEHSITGRCALSLQWIHNMWVIDTLLVLLRLTQWQFSRQRCGGRRHDLFPVLASDCVSIGSESAPTCSIPVFETPLYRSYRTPSLICTRYLTYCELDLLISPTVPFVSQVTCSMLAGWGSG